MKSVRFALTLALAAAPFAGAVTVSPGDNVQEELQEALILASPGDTIELAPGTYHFESSLSLDVDGVTVKGAGMDETILSFKNQNAGSEGLLVTSSGVVLRDFAIEDTVGDAIKVKGADGISFINVRTEWTGGPKSTNGAYGLYPVESKNVLIDGCVAVGASDAGIYVGQSQGIIVRNSVARYNVAGIEIENSYNADVYDNLAEHNTGGILVFDLPNLPQQGGHNVRVFNNRSIDNDTVNFAPAGNIVGNVPTGTGLIIMANRNVEVFGNEFSGNQTVNVSVSAYMAQPGEKMDPNYYPYPEGIHIHSNTYGRAGYAPLGVLADLSKAAARSETLPDITWDGRVNPDKAKNGQLPKESRLYINEGADVGFVNLDLGTFMTNPAESEPSTDISVHKGSLPPLPAVKLPQDKGAAASTD
jgi:parallel beta-helix repeat protein